MPDAQASRGWHSWPDVLFVWRLFIARDHHVASLGRVCMCQDFVQGDFWRLSLLHVNCRRCDLFRSCFEHNTLLKIKSGCQLSNRTLNRSCRNLHQCVLKTGWAFSESSSSLAASLRSSQVQTTVAFTQRSCHNPSLGVSPALYLQCAVHPPLLPFAGAPRHEPARQYI